MPPWYPKGSIDGPGFNETWLYPRSSFSNAGKISGRGHCSAKEVDQSLCKNYTKNENIIPITELDMILRLVFGFVAGAVIGFGW
jgi:hypothetical protein